MAETIKKKRGCAGYAAVACGLSLFVLMMCVNLPGPGVTTAARKAKASNTLTQIQTAYLAYYTEFGEWPHATENARLIKILEGDNPRGIPFLTLRPIDVDPSGSVIDPWGTPYRISVGADSKIKMISAGPDKTFGTPDDITSQ